MITKMIDLRIDLLATTDDHSVAFAAAREIAQLREAEAQLGE